MMRDLDDYLIDLEREALAHVLSELVARHPELQPEIEALCAAAEAVYAGGRALPPVDLALVQNTLRAIFRQSSSRYYGGLNGATVAGAARPWLDRAGEFLAAGRGEPALEILAVIADELMEAGDAVYDEEGELHECTEEIGHGIARALLLTPPPPEERRAWQNRIRTWSEGMGECIDPSVFRGALLAAKHGWEYPPLAAILRGEAGGTADYGEHAGGVVPALGPVVLDVLEQQGRWEELLRLGTALGAAERCVGTLVRNGRLDEAVGWCRQHPQSTGVLHRLVQTLAGAGLAGPALELAEQQLAAAKSLSFDGLALARWVRDEADTHGEPERAIAAVRLAAEHSLTLEDYHAARKVAGASWPALRKELLERVWNERNHFRFQAVDILLEEELFDQAVVAVDAAPNREALERVVEAVIPTHPDWVFSTCRREFDKLADSSRSNHYPEAVGWLERARQSLLQAGREAEWQEYLEKTIQEHFRKRALRPLLEELR